MIIFLINSIAAVLWLGLLAKLDTSSKHKEGRNPNYIFFIAGIISIAPAVALYWLFPYVDYSWKKETWMVFINMVFITGPVEEISKFAMFFMLAWKLRSIREPRDGMLQAASVGLGFAFYENFDYAGEYGIFVLLVRSVLCIAGHMIYASIWGIFTGRMIFEKRQLNKPLHLSLIAASLVVASLVHGLYDFFLDVNIEYIGFISALTVDYIAIFAAYKIYIKTATESPYKLYPLREFNKAITVINMALAHDPANLMLNKRIGLYYLYAGDYKSALEHFDTCTGISPDNFYCLAFSGVTLILSGKKEAGVKRLEQALEKISRAAITALEKNIRSVVDDHQVKTEILGLIERRG